MNPGATTCTADVDRSSRGLVDGRRDAGDRVAADADVAAIPGAAGPVDDSGVAEQQIVGARLEPPARPPRPRRPSQRRTIARKSRRGEFSVSGHRASFRSGVRSETRGSQRDVGARPRLLQPLLHERGLVVLALRHERLVQPEERPSVLAIALEVLPVDGLRFRGPARVEKRRAEPMPDRRMPVGRLGVGQRRPRAARRDRNARWPRRTASAAPRCRRRALRRRPRRSYRAD